MHVLFVGAGAVGQVYGRHAQKSGASVSFMVREKYVEQCQAGLSVYPLNRSKAKRWEPERFDGFGVLTTPDAVAQQSWDQVWLCMSSTALRRGTWFDELVPALGDATLVLLQPGLADRRFVLDRWPEERLVQGGISMVSYPAPLPGQELETPGVAYWFPPLAPSPFEGPRERTQAVVKMLKGGGCPASVVKGARRQTAFASAVMMPHLVALEVEGWSLSNLRGGDTLAIAAAASREAMAIAAAHGDWKVPMARTMVRSWLMSPGIGLAPCAVPFDLEVYLKLHFTKVGDQTLDFMNKYEELGASSELPHANLVQLKEMLEGQRASA